ncbi:tyrosine-type recombinase/integrase [Streptomyces mirabilis]|uniref:tyrosine-type recombinase/integrase n=1 Tax=Streptomyces mirabilis TaxID=68239 RepID=UPI0036B4E9CA
MEQRDPVVVRVEGDSQRTVLTDIDGALTEAFERLMHGLPELTDGKITVVNLCTEAGASCASYYRSPVGDDSSAQLPPPTPERVAEFFDFLKARIATARKYGPAARDNAMFRTLYHAGLRSEEASLLDRADAHFSRGPFGKLHVRFDKGARTSGPRPRWVPMLDGLDLVLHWFLDDVWGKVPNSPVLFADESGGSLHRGTIGNRLRYLMELEGRPATDRSSPHALRRACATHNYERGVDLVAIQQLLGHWTVSSTMRYVRPSATFMEDAYRRAVTTTLGELTAEEGSPA